MYVYISFYYIYILIDSFYHIYMYLFTFRQFIPYLQESGQQRAARLAQAKVIKSSLKSDFLHLVYFLCKLYKGNILKFSME